jgi:hypothetical protein
MKSLSDSLFLVRAKSNQATRKTPNNLPLVAKAIGFDATDVRRYFCGPEKLAREAKKTDGVRVMDLALHLVAHQYERIAESVG